MAWMETTAERRGDPRALWPDVRSVIMLGMNYGPDSDPLAILRERSRGAISVYAQGDDYHEVIKPRLKALARWLIAHAGGDVKVFVDTAAVMEKPLAQAAGLGWQGKHTNLVSREFGSWLFLGAIFTTLEIAARCARGRPLRQLPRLPRHLPDRGVSGALPARCAALHLLSHDRAQGPDPARAARRAWATASMAATTVWRSARGTSSRSSGARRSFPRASGSRRRRSPTSRGSTMRHSARCLPNRRSSASGATASCAMC